MFCKICNKCFYSRNKKLNKNLRVEDDNLQCGYEHECKKKDCINCKKLRKKFYLSLSLAEQVAIEDCAVCDLKAMQEVKPKVMELMQKIMHKVMQKVFREEDRIIKEQKKKKGKNGNKRNK